MSRFSPSATVCRKGKKSWVVVSIARRVAMQAARIWRKRVKPRGAFARSSARDAWLLTDPTHGRARWREKDECPRIDRFIEFDEVETHAEAGIAFDGQGIVGTHVQPDG